MWLMYDETYAVSEDGLVMNRKTGKILKGFPNNKEYLQIKLYGNNNTIHRMIALRFLPKIDLPELEVDHINRDRTDNRACNLRWVDRSENSRNKPATNISKKKNGFQVRFNRDGNEIHYSWHKTIEEAIAARDAFKNSPEYL